MADHATDWIKRVGLDGYRVDCAGGGPPNWRPYGDNRPSMSGLAGGLGVLTAARQEMETQKPEVFLLAEAGGPPFSRAANFTYNWAFLFSVAPALVDEGAATWVPRVSEWLEQQRYSFPRGSRQIMCLENHDTVRALLKFGVGTQKALLALAAFSDATPFLYHDQEIGYGPYLKRLYAVRREHDELTLGDASYTAIPASDASVLTILRTYEGRTALVAINFSGQPATCTVDLSGCPGLDPKQRFSLWDAFGERPVAGDLKPKLDLLPYSPAVILIRPAGEAPPAPPTRAGGQASLPARYPEVTRDGDRVTVSNGVYEMRIGPETGGLIESFTVNGQTLLGPMRFGTAGRRLWLGGDLVLGPDTFRSVGIKSGGEGAEVIVRGVVNRTLGGQTEPALDYQLTYYCFATPSISCRLTLTPRVNIEGVLGSLATTLAFPGATRWSANTFEGLLYDDLIPRRLDDQPYHSMYVRPHSDRLFSSESLPLDPQHGFIGAEWPDGTTLRVAARGWATGVPNAVLLKERLGDATGLHALLSWADGTKPLTLVKGQTYEVSYGLTVSAASPMQETAPRAEPHVPQLTAEGSRYIVETPTLRAAIARSKGGSLEELSLRGGGGTVAGTNVYSDYGIYGDWTDPSGVKHRTTALSRLDVECEPTIEWLPDPLRLTFEGVFRDANWSGRPIPEPRTQYRVSYEFTDEPFVSVECSARPQVTKAQVKAFLAQTLSLTGAGPWAVVAGETPRLLASGKPPGPGDRVWQSIADPLTDADLPRLFVETPGPTCVEFSDFAGLQDVQNLFYLQGRADSVLFIAFLDGQPEDLVPRWFTVRYRITPHRGALGEVLRTLGLPEPQEGTR
ncbi:MAG: hypothetical protein FJX75_26995 [Armatimonadetes bacterium]|nr:hypothetical protein [Armatimonadota bacterium]